MTSFEMHAKTQAAPQLLYPGFEQSFHKHD